jgi:N-hydroxyarylamine O-acetyltransferase
MMPAVDLNAYFARIGYAGAQDPRLETLRALQSLHVAAIPFEAIDVLLGRGISLDPRAVDDKLIQCRRGGYCFEQNGLFLRVLRELGFHVEPLIARVLWRARPDAPPQARTHMALRVTLDSASWLVDVGFGMAVPTAPLLWYDRGVQATPLGSFRLSDVPFGLLVETDLPGSWTPMYQISLEPPLEVDFAMANWFTSTYPNSSFRRSLVVARATPERRAALLDNQLTLRSPGAESRREMLDIKGLERALCDVFGLSIEPEWRPLLRRIALCDAVKGASQ